MKEDNDYKQWLTDLKSRIRQSQIKAAVKVNTELLRLYWDLGQDIVARQMETTWGSGFFEQLSKDLRSEFPDMQGFSERNLLYIKRFYQFYTQDDTILQQLVEAIPQQLAAELQVAENKRDIIRQQVADELATPPIFQIPWFHHVQIFTKCKSVKEALFYVQKTIENGWSRAVLMNFLEADLFSAQGKALTNFSRLLPEPQSDLANQILKDPYNFDFLALTENYKEKELEDALTTNITKFLLELGQGFAYIGRQIPVKIGETERFIDLLFYHLELRCFVVIELKAGKFEAEYIGKLGLYISAINHQKKKETDGPTIGMIICKTKDHIEVQYSLEVVNQPIGVSEYQLSKLLPDNLKSSMPSIEEIEEELKKMYRDKKLIS
ncbi:MAG: PDDEXK nuclease domain-containing protein [Prevotellaceae bacterium]|jgi:predicted nuclease of restriction endonuclease-like (RecB) superfamily|nr:PDDEXK nuclease domain-containing protein [Prevotellaceae bacterium]